MKVSELKEKLQEFPQNDTVVIVSAPLFTGPFIGVDGGFIYSAHDADFEDVVRVVVNKGGKE